MQFVSDIAGNTTRYIIDDLNLDVQRGELLRDEEAITLPKLSYDLLVALAKAAPALLSQAELMAIVWPDRVIGDETLKQRVKLLRKSLGDNASAPKYIEAVRGRGYRLLPPVKCECVVRQPPSVMLDLSANDRFPNLTSHHLGSMWRLLSILGLLISIITIISIVVTSTLLSNDLPEKSISQSTQFIKNQATVSQENEQSKAQRFYQRGRDYYHRYRKQDNEIAIDFFKKAISENNDYAQAYAALSQAYSQRFFQFSGHESDKQLAIDNAYLALSYNNQLASAYKALGTAYYVSGWLSKSVNTLQRGLIIESNELEIMINLAFILSEQGELKRALFWHEKILKQAPEHAVAMMHTALTLQRAKQYKAAKAWYLKALDLQPDYLLSRYHLAQLAIAEKNYEKALFLTKLKPSDNHEQQAIFIEAQADIAFFENKLPAARALYQQAAKLMPEGEYSRAKLFSGLLAERLSTDQADKLAHQERNSVIIKKLKELQQYGNEKAQVSLLLAQNYSMRGQKNLAMRYFIQAVEQGYQLDYRVLRSPFFTQLLDEAQFKNFTVQLKESIEIAPFFEL